MNFTKGQCVRVKVPNLKPRFGKVARDNGENIVYVTLWSERLGRYSYGTTAYHRRFLFPWTCVEHS